MLQITNSTIFEKRTALKIVVHDQTGFHIVLQMLVVL